MELETRRVHIAGIVHNAYDAWMKQMARNLTDPVHGFLKDVRYLIHDRDPLFRYGFADVLKAGGVRPVMLPARSPNLNSFMERWIRSARSECLRHIIPLGQRHLRWVLSEYVAHHNRERNHQGQGNRLIELGSDVGVANDNSAFPVRRRQRLGGCFLSIIVKRLDFCCGEFWNTTRKPERVKGPSLPGPRHGKCPAETRL